VECYIGREGGEFWSVTLVGRDLGVLEWFIGRGRGVEECYIGREGAGSFGGAMAEVGWRGQGVLESHINREGPGSSGVVHW
jgi:hypothetical protein